MIEIPESLVELCLAQQGDVECDDRAAAAQELERLGIPGDSQFTAFYLRFCPTVFSSPHSYEELNDLTRGSVRDATAFVHETWELPHEFVCLTSCEGEGCYLYSKETGAVYDFSLADRDTFVAQLPQPIAPDIFRFIEWYLGPGT